MPSAKPPLLLAPPDKLRRLAELRARKAELDARDLATRDVFSLIGYEPVCKPRVLAQKAGAEVIPEPCGQCPQELFHAATEADVLYGGAAGGGKARRSSQVASGHVRSIQVSGCCWSAGPTTS